MRRIFLSCALALVGTFALANDTLTESKNEIMALVDDCFSYFYSYEVLTIYADGSWEYYGYFESGIICN